MVRQISDKQQKELLKAAISDGIRTVAYAVRHYGDYQHIKDGDTWYKYMGRIKYDAAGYVKMLLSGTTDFKNVMPLLKSVEMGRMLYLQNYEGAKDLMNKAFVAMFYAAVAKTVIELLWFASNDSDAAEKEIFDKMFCL
jgi:hypothetical protein